MKRTMGPRPMLFGAAGALSALVGLAAPPELQWVAWVTAGMAVFWTVLLAVEELTKPLPGARADELNTRRSGTAGSAAPDLPRPALEAERAASA